MLLGAETLPCLLPLLEPAPPEAKRVRDILRALIEKRDILSAPLTRASATPMLGFAQFGYSLESAIPVIVLSNLTKKQLGFDETQYPDVCVIENPGCLVYGASRTDTIVQTPRLDIQNMDRASLLHHAEQILRGKGGIQWRRKERIISNNPQVHGSIPSPGVWSGRSISGVDQEDKGTFGLQVKCLQEVTGKLSVNYCRDGTACLPTTSWQ